ncbi:hypothetical protein OSB04_016546 [Centaurea solstitialis]|uniref:NADPH-dependent pterin aldehyde reductase n=1 Tax=Centaurea solstitialis TaxID=347529 RepID=A0AA38WL65_9ASTR|nr:hypothetical protein OSB04_016546 [Centaurea solstitialis]
MTTATLNAAMNGGLAAAAAGGAGGGGGGVIAQKTVLITGVSRGLGRALALELGKRGHSVIGCSRTQQKLDSLQSDLSSEPSSSSSSSEKHLFMNVDVCSNSSVQELARVVMEKKGVPDIIVGLVHYLAFCYIKWKSTYRSIYSVNNAGTINKNNRLWEVPEEEFNAVIDTNLKGIANMLRHFIPLMIEKKQGILVNMSSGWGRSAAAQVAPYCASKWAVEGLTKSVAKELPSGMAIVALNPGVINTEMLASCFGSSSSLYQPPESWAPKAADMILNLTMADNGASLSV